MKMGEKLKLLRKLKGYTQADVAGKLNLSRRAYANLENNQTNPGLDRITQLAEIYGIKTEEFLSFNENQAFTNCFNNNALGFYHAEKVTSKANNEERRFFMEQLQTLVQSFKKERQTYLEVIQSLTVK